MKNRRTCAIVASAFLLSGTAIAGAGETDSADHATQMARFERIRDGLTLLSQQRPAIAVFLLSNGRFPNSIKEAGLATAPPSGSDIASLEVDQGGVMTVKFARFPGVADAWIGEVPNYTSSSYQGPNSITWHCQSNIPDIAKIAPVCSYVAVRTRVADVVPAADTVNTVAQPPVAPATGSNCARVQRSIEAKLARHRVIHFTLDVVEASQQATGKIVGHCGGGTKKIVYARGTVPGDARK